MRSSFPAAAGALLVVVVGVLVIAVGAGYALANQTPEQAATTTDQLTVNYSQPSTLSQAGIVVAYDNLTITSGNTTLDAGTDYTFANATGNVTWINTSATAAGDTATATYGYQYHPRETRQFLAVVDPLVNIALANLVWIAAAVAIPVAVVTAIAAGLGSVGGSYGR